MPWLEDRLNRDWEFVGGNKVEAAYDSYHNGIVTLILAEDNRRLDVSLHKLSRPDQAYVRERLARPHGEIDKVTFVGWREGRPVFRAGITYSPRGSATVSPVVNLAYLLQDPRTGFIKRSCERVRVYPTRGKLPLDGLAPNTAVELAGAVEREPGRLRVFAHRSALLLPVDAPAGYRVLDTFIEQNDHTLRLAGAPVDWWQPGVPCGPLPGAEPGAQP